MTTICLCESSDDYWGASAKVSAESVSWSAFRNCALLGASAAQQVLMVPSSTADRRTTTFAGLTIPVSSCTTTQHSWASAGAVRVPKPSLETIGASVGMALAFASAGPSVIEGSLRMRAVQASSRVLVQPVDNCRRRSVAEVVNPND